MNKLKSTQGTLWTSNTFDMESTIIDVPVFELHYSDHMMGAMASQITSVSIIYSAVCSGADQRRHRCSASLAFVRGIDRWIPHTHRGPGPCITNVIATCRKNFSQWESSFLWKLRYHWLKFLRRVAKTLVIQGPVTRKRFPFDDVIIWTNQIPLLYIYGIQTWSYFTST